MGANIGATPISDIKLGSDQVYKVYQGSNTVWDSGITPPPAMVRALKFTASGAQTLGVDSTKLGTIQPNFEYSTDGGSTWTAWNVANTLSFGNGTDLYVRGSNTFLAKSGDNYTHFVFSTSEPVACSGNIMHLFDYTQDLTAFPDDASLSSRGIKYMFQNATALTTPPILPATALVAYCYLGLFSGCTTLIALPSLNVSMTQAEGMCNYMFDGCSQIKMSATQTGEYQNAYTFLTAPISATANNMFANTGGTFTGTPAQQTYYTSNTIVS